MTSRYGNILTDEANGSIDIEFSDTSQYQKDLPQQTYSLSNYNATAQNALKPHTRKKGVSFINISGKNDSESENLKAIIFIVDIVSY
jgi:hypothetical protein